MFTINYFGNQKKLINNLEDKKMGTQSRIYDYNTGIYARILPNNDGKYSFAESGITSAGVFFNLYGFETPLDIDFILNDIDNLCNISTDEVNFIIQNGFFEFLMQKGTISTSKDGFKTLLKTERILKNIEDSGKIKYEDVLQEIKKRLELKDLSEEDKKIIEQIQKVYKNTLFIQVRQGQEFNALAEEKQRDQNSQHTAKEISDDLNEIARTSSKEDALKQIVNSKNIELTLSDYGFDENGFMFQEYGIEQIKLLYEAFKDDFDENGLPLPNEENDYAGTQLAEIMYNYTRYLKDKAQSEKNNENENIK